MAPTTMPGFVRRHLTYANVMATIAVFLALGGTSYAALQLPANSVGSNQIQTGAVTGSKVKNGSLTVADLRPGASRALRGSDGRAGPAGPAGGFNPDRISYVLGEEGFVSPGGFTRVSANCPPDGRVIGGGFSTGSGVSISASFPSAERTGWVVYATGIGSIPAPTGVYAYAVCATG